LISQQALLAIASGAAVGFSLGIIGGGGSILAVPLLLYVVGVKDAHIAIGTSAFAVAVNAFINLFSHWRAGNVHWPCALVFGAAGAIGAAIGSSLGKLVPGENLLFLFGLVMIAVAIAMLRPRASGGQICQRLTRAIAFRLVGVGLAAGTISGFFGIGGGFLIVPGLMLSSGLPLINAIGSSLFGVGTFGLTTAVNYAISGFVDWEIAAEFILGGAAGGFLGMRAACRLSTKKQALNYLFAGVIFAVALYMMARTALHLFA
jgi:uncharacterized membrane protein YfcA